MDVGFQWALLSNWKLAPKLGHRAAGFLNKEGRLAEGIHLYRQLLRTTRERDDPHEIERCLRELSWIDDQEGSSRRTTINAKQAAFNFTG